MGIKWEDEEEEGFKQPRFREQVNLASNMSFDNANFATYMSDFHDRVSSKDSFVKTDALN